jgi:hypothetical protein
MIPFRFSPLHRPQWNNCMVVQKARRYSIQKGGLLFWGSRKLIMKNDVPSLPTIQKFLIESGGRFYRRQNRLVGAKSSTPSTREQRKPTKSKMLILPH